MELDKHGAFKSLLALGEVFNAAVERVHDPCEEGGQRHGEREDKGEDPCTALIQLDEHNADRVQHAKYKVRCCEQAHSRHHGPDGRSDHSVTHAVSPQQHHEVICPLVSMKTGRMQSKVRKCVVAHLRNDEQQEKRKRVPSRIQDACQHEQEPRHRRGPRMAVDRPNAEKVDQVVVEVIVVRPLRCHFHHQERNGARDEVLHGKQLVPVLDAQREPESAEGDIGDGEGKVKVEFGVLGSREIAFELVEELDSTSEGGVDRGFTGRARRVVLQRG